MMPQTAKIRVDNPNRGRMLRPALTLVELMISMAIMSMLFAATMSAVVVATHALPDPQSDAERLVAAQQVLERLVGDLSYATTIDKKNPAQIEMIVPDRGHGQPGPETIEYKWDGNPGDPLNRTYNDGNAIVLVDNVYAFALTYRTQTDASNQTWTRSITIVLQVGPDAADQLQTEVHLLNDVP